MASPIKFVVKTIWHHQLNLWWRPKQLQGWGFTDNFTFNADTLLQGGVILEFIKPVMFIKANCFPYEWFDHLDKMKGISLQLFHACTPSVKDYNEIWLNELKWERIQMKDRLQKLFWTRKKNTYSIFIWYNI